MVGRAGRLDWCSSNWRRSTCVWELRWRASHSSSRGVRVQRQDMRPHSARCAHPGPVCCLPFIAGCCAAPAAPSRRRFRAGDCSTPPTRTLLRPVRSSGPRAWLLRVTPGQRGASTRCRRHERRPQPGRAAERQRQRGQRRPGRQRRGGGRGIRMRRLGRGSPHTAAPSTCGAAAVGQAAVQCRRVPAASLRLSPSRRAGGLLDLLVLQPEGQ